MARFDPSLMPDTVSPTVKLLRTFVEHTMEDEIDSVLATHGAKTAEIVEASLRTVTMRIFHKNPEVHSTVKEDLNAFDAAIQNLFNVIPEETEE